MENSHSYGVNDHSHGDASAEAHAGATHEAAHVHDPAHAEAMDDAAHAETAPAMSKKDQIITTAVTVGVVGVAAIVFEAALIPGMILGVAAALAPSYVPRVGAALNPLFRTTIRNAYKFGQKTKEAASEVREQMSDIAAEVSAEGAGLDKTKPVAS